MIDGPLQFAGPQTAAFFRAFVNTKHVQVLKVNHSASKSQKECQLYDALKIDAEHFSVALAPVRLLSLDKSSKHQTTRSSPTHTQISPFLGLLMPYYAYSFGELPAPITCTYALQVFRRIILAIDFIHDRGWMHGDVKPGSIFCGCDGEAWLGDYGSSVLYDELHSFTGGTPKYQCEDVPGADAGELIEAICKWIQSAQSR
jgi:serine/threonine protein kinase